MSDPTPSSVLRLGAMGAADILSAGSAGTDALLEEGAQNVRVVGSNSYDKLYHFYSGSVISKSQFSQDGYQDTFDWVTHRYKYAEVVTVYEEIETYTAVAASSITVSTTDDRGSHGVFTTTGETNTLSTEYEWVRSERSPTVETSWGDYQLYIAPGSMGIVSESDSGYENTDTRTHESSYVDNGNVSFSQPTAGGSVTATTSEAEATFISTLFGYDSNQSVANMIDDFFNAIADDLFRTTLADRDSFMSTEPQKLTTTDLTAIMSGETVETAIINPSVGVTENPFVGVTDHTGEHTTTSAEESDAMATMYSGPSWTDYEDA
jgi:hypothetical protein